MNAVWEADWWRHRLVHPKQLDPISWDDDFENVVQQSTRIDCRRMNAGFLFDSGAELLAELVSSAVECPKQPAFCCVYQLDGAWVAVTSGQFHVEVGARNLDGPKVDYLSAYVHLADEPPPDYDEDLFDTFFDVYQRSDWEALVASSAQHGDYSPVVSCVTGDGPSRDRDSERQVYLTMVLGLLSLMDEKLIREQRIGGATMTRAARLLHKGKAPNQSYRIVTLNLAETRRRTKGVRLLKHETPMLHWRRGHWRTLHRKSEFERRVWIKRMLVGDPSRGFVAKEYRTIWQPTIH